MDITGIILESPFGIMEDCPGLYIKGGQNQIGESLSEGDILSIFNKFIGKRIRLTIEEIEDNTEELIEEMTVGMSISQIFDKGSWFEYCEWRGLNEWCVREGRMEMSERVEVPISIARKLNLI